MTTPRTNDDGRNERQRQEQNKIERQRQADRDIRQSEYDDEKRRQDPDETRRDPDEDRRDPRTGLIGKPEDPHPDHRGQQTRDNVNPAIPSAPPGEGGIVDPRSLGMESQAGVAPPRAENQPEQWPKIDETTGQATVAPRAIEGLSPDMVAAHMPSPNEPFGSSIASGDAGPVELPPLVLTDISPDSIVAGSPEDLVLTVTGSGFGPNCVILFDDEEMGTTLVNETTLSASVPVAAEAGIVDVEVARGEDLSDVLTFEFVAPAGRRSSEKAERKPKKAEPRGKRQKKDKSKGRK
jgi:hypothetical protein